MLEDAIVLSVVVPLLNEEEVLETSYRRLRSVLEGMGIGYEIVFVDDGSDDRSPDILRSLAAADAHVRVLMLSRNFGHELATTAGLHHARGQAAVVIDADMQDPPEVVPTFVAKWREGFDVVYGVRTRRAGEKPHRKLASFAFYRLMASIADVPIPKDVGDFRLMSRRVLDVYRQFEEEPRFFRGLVTWIGFKQIGVPFVREPRAAGTSKYRYGRLLKLAFDTITAFSSFPALAITALAGFFWIATVGLSVALVALHGLQQCTVPSWGWVALGFLYLWNIQFSAFAVVSEYLVRTHRHTQRRPLYVIEERIGGGASMP